MKKGLTDIKPFDIIVLGGEEMIAFLIVTFLITSIFATTIGAVVYIVSEEKLNKIIQK